MHTLIVGPKGVGKSTLIRRVLGKLHRPVWGFITKKEDSLAADALGSPVYIYPAGNRQCKTENNLICYTGHKDRRSMTAAFDRFAPTLQGTVPEGSVVQLDELGFMESDSQAFCSAVLALLDGSAPVIAAVKDRDTPFLNKVRNHPNCRCFYITEENRDELFEKVLLFVEEQLKRENSPWQEKR